MGWDAFGWVEMRRPVDPGDQYAALDTDDPYAVWQGVATVAPILVERNAHLWSLLFGVPFRYGEPFIGLRGFPDDASDETVHAFAGYGARNLRQGSPSTYVACPTWMLWSELAVLDWEQGAAAGTTAGHPPTLASLVNPEWQLLLALMRLLAQQVGVDNVRLVLWFDR